jgi:hypothetical protein
MGRCAPGATRSRVRPALVPVRGGPADLIDLPQQPFADLLFGGLSAPPASAALGDTWAFDGTSWRRLTPAKAPSLGLFSSIKTPSDREPVLQLSAQGVQV